LFISELACAELHIAPFTPVENVPAEKSIDATHKLMQIIIDDYERGLDYTSYDNLREQMN
jgi:hypothetical protein